MSCFLFLYLYISEGSCLVCVMQIDINYQLPAGNSPTAYQRETVERVIELSLWRLLYVTSVDEPLHHTIKLKWWISQTPSCRWDSLDGVKAVCTRSMCQPAPPQGHRSWCVRSTCHVTKASRLYTGLKESVRFMMMSHHIPPLARPTHFIT